MGEMKWMLRHMAQRRVHVVRRKRSEPVPNDDGLHLA